MVTKGETDCEPPVAALEVQGAEQEVASAEVQESVEELPEMTDGGVAVRLTVATGGCVIAVTVAEYPLGLPTLSTARMR